MGSVLARAFVCGVAGALAWLVTEPGFGDSLGSADWARQELWMLLALGGLVGAASGLLAGLQRGGKYNVTVSIALGLVLGAIGATFAHGPASALFSALGGSAVGNPVQNIVPRTAAFLPLGGLLGLAVGASQRALRPAIAGLVGGLIAAFATGAVFDLVSASLASAKVLSSSPGTTVETGSPGRALMCLGLGLGVGLFTGIADRVSRRAWIRLVLGRNEGRDWPLDSAATMIGRDERAHVPVFSDPNLAALAAVIERKSGRYVLVDPGTQIGVGHNGVRVASAELRPGDTIQIGTLQFEFHTRGAQALRAPVLGGAPIVPGPATTIATPPMATGDPTVAVAHARTLSPGSSLVVASGPMAGTRVPVDRLIEIGREGSGFALPLDPQASRKHCLVEPSPAGIAFSDLGSTNGTLVNGMRRESGVLQPGDTLQIGSTTFRVEQASQ
ncbi:MAG: FHA domain-containing protein [Fimbriimonadaceae bacterium]